jgi:hypothetical protein
MMANNRYCGNPLLKQQKNFTTEKFNGGSSREPIRCANTEVMLCYRRTTQRTAIILKQRGPTSSIWTNKTLLHQDN